MGSRRLERALLGVIATVVAASAIYTARGLLIPIVVAILLSLLLRPVVLALGRLRIPESAGSAIVVTLGVALVGALAMYLHEPAARLVQMGPGEIRSLETKLRQLARPVQAIRGATDKVSQLAEAAEPAAPAKREVVMEKKPSLSWLPIVQTTLAAIGSTVILLYFLLASGDVFLRKLIRVLPGLRDRILAVEMTRSLQAEISRYFATVTLINIGLGVVTALTMAALQMPTPALIGTAAAVLNFVPYVGSLLTLTGILLGAAVTFDAAWQIALPPLAYLAISAIEGQVVQPLLLGRSLAVNPVVLFVWMLLWGWLWGIAGILVAVPMLVALKICADRFESLALIAEFVRR
jgi:predicted PurR-regulated permease PerM